MNQTAMHAAVAILERMNINKAKGGRRRRQHRVNPAFTHAVIGFQQPAHEIVQTAEAFPHINHYMDCGPPASQAGIATIEKIFKVTIGPAEVREVEIPIIRNVTRRVN